jgi:predicted amidohydrolase
MDENLNKIADMVFKAKEQRVNLVCLPENALLMPSSTKQLREEADYMAAHRGVKYIQRLAENFNLDILIGSVPVYGKSFEKLFNRSVYVSSSGEILAYYDKMHLFDAKLSNHERYSESRIFNPGKKMKIYWTKFGKMGFSICFDLRFPYLFRKMAQKGAEFFVVPAAFSATTGRQHWEVLLRARAIENGAFIVAPATCGKHDNGRKTHGHSMIIAPDGRIIEQASLDKEEVIVAEINLEEVTQARRMLKTLKKDVIT